MSYYLCRSNDTPIEYVGFADNTEKVLCQYILDQLISKISKSIYDVYNSPLYRSDRIIVDKSGPLISFFFCISMSKSRPLVRCVNNRGYNINSLRILLHQEEQVQVMWQYSFESCNMADIQEYHITNAANEYSRYWRSVYSIMRPYFPSATSCSKYNNESFKKLFEGKKVAFVIMKFSKDERFNNALSTIKNVLQDYSIIGVRADEHQFARTIWENIKAYMDNADFGIAITDSVEEDYINSNVSVEIGYMLALKKKVCLLKEKSLDKLHSDFAGIIYKEFDINNVEGTIPTVLTDWMKFEKIIK